MSATHRTFDEACLAAEKVGLLVRTPKPNELFVDIDSPLDLERFYRALPHVYAAYDIGSLDLRLPNPKITVSPSQSPGRYHAVVALREAITHVERAFLQAILGDDPARCLHNMRRAKAGEDKPICFFEKP